MEAPEYPKIQSMFERTDDGHLLLGRWARTDLEFLAELEWVATEKIDGTNVRVWWDEEGFLHSAGKTDAAEMPAHLRERLWLLFEGKPLAGLVLYGEGCGAKIQKGGGNYRADGAEFVLFDVWAPDDRSPLGLWLERHNVEDIALQLGCAVAPIVMRDTLPVLEDFVRGGFSSAWGPFAAEGIVARPAVELRTRRGERVITKLKHRDFQRVVEREA